jgi:hypothetical protein
VIVIFVLLYQSVIVAESLLSRSGCTRRCTAIAIRKLQARRGLAAIAMLHDQQNDERSAPRGAAGGLPMFKFLSF